MANTVERWMCACRWGRGASFKRTVERRDSSCHASYEAERK